MQPLALPFSTSTHLRSLSLSAPPPLTHTHRRTHARTHCHQYCRMLDGSKALFASSRLQDGADVLSSQHARRHRKLFSCAAYWPGYKNSYAEYSLGNKDLAANHSQQKQRKKRKETFRSSVFLREQDPGDTCVAGPREGLAAQGGQHPPLSDNKCPDGLPLTTSLDMDTCEQTRKNCPCKCRFFLKGQSYCVLVQLCGFLLVWLDPRLEFRIEGRTDL